MPQFSAAVQAWFDGAFPAPTTAQTEAWAAIGRGEHTLVVAPTGSGKTLAAFLSALDRLGSEPPPTDPSRRCRVVYVSPLKALAVDVERNLRAPLAGIRRAAARAGLPVPEVTVAMRSGDTPPEERRRFARAPSDILITTPESLFLLLTSAAREALRGVDTVIVDEVHSVCATKRGAHLAVSLERLDALLRAPAQRIGLSATVRPVAEVAGFLAGGRAVTVVQPPAAKPIGLRVVVPVEDMTDPGHTAADPGRPVPDPERPATDPGRPATDPERPAADRVDWDVPRRASIWPHVEQRLLELIRAHRSTIVFANSRRVAERLTARLNELAAARPAAHDADRFARRGAAESRHFEGHGTTARARGAEGDTVVARAHHGSMSREQRAVVEEDLKAGRLPAVVATSSLELGIDMGAVDLVVQVGAPPSVASGLQRVGRAGHQVGAVSEGVIFPMHRGDLVECAVVAERMRDGLIEAMRYPRNPLDVLAQQIVAMVAMDPHTVDGVAALVRRAAPFAELPDSALRATLDMLSGRYPADAFAELRPRLVWDRASGQLTARGGAQRLAVTAGGTIPDRGLYGVFLAGADGPGRRVGELDEEMVYESRVGDVFLLGSSSWRITDITHDRVLVAPAPGEAGRMPFWKGDTAGRPVELGRALGGFLREVGDADRGPGPAAARAREQAAARARAAGLDEWGAGNLLAYLDAQREATGHLPDDRTVLVERFRDELGDWRLVVHSPFGSPVNAPWALAIAARLRARHGLEAQPMHSDDGIVLRLPDTGAEPPGAELVVFDPDEIEALVTAEVGGSALFAARFRECAARSLLLPRRDPSRRRALWQQRQRASQLLQVARGYAEFPVVLEAMRECLQDVFDLAGLASLMSDLAARRVRLVTVQTPAASPFARSLLFGYVGAFLYEGDAPLAERRAQALALNPTLLADLLGSADLRELLDASVVAAVVDEAQRLVASRHARGVDAAHDLLRGLGDLSTDEALARGATAAELAELQAQRRAIRVRIGGEQRWLAVEDASRVRDALGVALPAEVPAAFAEPVRDPLGDLIGRYARTHGPFVASDVATRLGLGRAVVDDALLRLRADGQLIAGRFPRGHAGISAGNGGGGRAESTAGVSAEAEWCDAEVLRTIRRRSLAALRREVEPAPPIALARFLPAWQGVGEVGGAGRRERGVGGVARVIEQLAGAPLVASALESLVLPSRVADYSPALLDELTAAGEVLWAGAGSLSRGDGWIVLAPTEQAPLLLPEPSADGLGEPHRALLSALGADAALFFRALADRVHAARATAAGRTAADPADADPPGAELSDPVTTRFSDDALAAAIWDLVWAGWVTNDTLAPLRSLMHTGYGRSSPRSQAPRARYGRRSGYARYPGLAAPRGAASTALNLGGSPGTKTRLGPAGASALVGRWSQLPPREADATRRAVAAAEAMVERHGVLTRGAVVAERWPGGFAAVYPVLKAAEESGRLRRGYFVEELGGAQFAQPGAVDRLRERATPDDAPADAAPDALVLAATDPANPYGAALAWPSPAPPLELGDPTNPGRRHQPGRDPDSDRSDPVSRGHQPARKGGALVVLVGGACVLYVERGGRAFLSFTDDPDLLRTAAEALVAAARARAFTRLVVERADGVRVVGTALGEALTAAGFSPTPRGLRLRLQ